jgi:hypothetical protein
MGIDAAIANKVDWPQPPQIVMSKNQRTKDTSTWARFADRKSRALLSHQINLSRREHRMAFELLGEPGTRLSSNDRRLLLDLQNEASDTQFKSTNKDMGASHSAWDNHSGQKKGESTKNPVTKEELAKLIPPLDLIGNTSSKGGTQLTFNIMGHKSITHDALTPLGFASTSLFAAELGDLSQDLGHTTRGDPTHHFDDNKIDESLKVVEEHRKAIITRLSKDKLSSEDKFAVLYEFGQLSHTVQDFYAHSNFVELSLKENPALKPEQVELIHWDKLSVNASSKSSVSTENNLKTGYYFYKNQLQNELIEFFLTRNMIVRRLEKNHLEAPNTRYLRTRDYRKLSTFQQRIDYATDPTISVLHEDLAKDDEDSDEGKAINPTTKMPLYQYARSLALRETQRQWSEIENSIRATHTPQESANILYELEHIPKEGPVNKQLLTVQGLITANV